MKEIIKKVLVESGYSKHTTCTQYGGITNSLCKNLELLGNNLHKDSGLGLKKIINDKLAPHKTPVPKAELEKFTEGLRILYKTGKYDRDYIIKVKNELDSFTRVHQGNDWHFVNKLNTNRRDLAEFLTKMISDNYDNKEIFSINMMFDNLGRNIDGEEITWQTIIDHLKALIEPLKDSAEVFDIESLKNFTRNTKNHSEIGESSERETINYLRYKGIKILYNGGNGDFIDMKFGVDIIAQTEEGMKLIQVKASENFDPSDIRSEIDWVCISSKRKGIVFYENGNLSEKKIVTYKGELMCRGSYCEKRYW